MEFTREVVDALGAAFPEDEIEFLPRATSGGMALGLPYIDARSVMRRLDAVVGPANWSYDFDVLSPDGKMVRGRLTVLGVTKCDAGEANQEDEPLKSAVSDALKRAAVHFGIGRYLYYLPRIWAPYDAQKRRFIESPRLDPGAVARALSVCGITAPAGARPGRPAPQRPEAREAAPANGAAENRPAENGEAGRAESGPAAENGRVAEGVRPVEAAPAVEPIQRMAQSAVEPTQRVAQPAGRTVEAPSPAAPQGETAGSRKSIWNTGGNGRSAAPESAGDRAATRTEAPRPRPETPAQGMVCSNAGCGKALTKGQHDVSVRAFGQPLCPACQKQHTRTSG